jgi:hypothetical protein
MRARGLSPNWVKTRSLGLNAALDRLAGFQEDADLAGILVDVYPDVLHD